MAVGCISFTAMLGDGTIMHCSSQYGSGTTSSRPSWPPQRPDWFSKHREEGMNSVVTFGGALDKGMNSMVNFGSALDEDMNLVVDFGGTLDDGMNGMVVSGFSRSSSGAGSKNHGLKLASTGVVRTTTRSSRSKTSECTNVMSQLVVMNSDNNEKLFIGRDKGKFFCQARSPFHHMLKLFSDVVVLCPDLALSPPFFPPSLRLATSLTSLHLNNVCFTSLCFGVGAKFKVRHNLLLAVMLGFMKDPFLHMRALARKGVGFCERSGESRDVIFLLTKPSSLIPRGPTIFYIGFTKRYSNRVKRTSYTQSSQIKPSCSLITSNPRFE
ncbi:hypothetical protein HKD37_08G021756 [Glycine soja]